MAQLFQGENGVQEVVILSKEGLDESTLSRMRDALTCFISVYNKKYTGDTIQEFKISIKKFHPAGRRMEFLINAKLLTSNGKFFVKKKGWNAVIVFNSLLSALRRQVLEPHLIRNTFLTGSRG